MKIIYWKSDKFWLGKFFEHPEIMTQGETLEELEENLKDAYLMMAMENCRQSIKLMYQINFVAQVLDGLEDAEAKRLISTEELLEKVDQWSK